MTRSVVAYVLTSLDGAVDDPRRYFPATDATAPGPPEFDDESEEVEAGVIATQDAVLLGRGMYDEWARYWPTSTQQPFADFINGVRKYVFTSSPLTTPWQNAEAVHEPAADVVRRLKQEAGGDIGVHGSITLVRSLLAEGLVDELVLGMGPVIDPEGRRLFEQATEWTRLWLTQATPTSSGIVWLRYRLGSSVPGADRG
ncbi:dihydrofolate reductase family protein [Calidifontibacter terrae]